MTVASGGQIEEEVFVVRDKTELSKFKADTILVTKITDPSCVPVMAQSVGIITDIGGITSHPAIISRELGIPCVVGTKEATKKLKSGDRVF